MFLASFTLDRSNPNLLQLAADAMAHSASVAGSMMTLFAPYQLTLMMYRLGRSNARVLGLA